jgi:hypothetical protein
LGECLEPVFPRIRVPFDVQHDPRRILRELRGHLIGQQLKGIDGAAVAACYFPSRGAAELESQQAVLGALLHLEGPEIHAFDHAEHELADFADLSLYAAHRRLAGRWALLSRSAFRRLGALAAATAIPATTPTAISIPATAAAPTTVISIPTAATAIVTIATPSTTITTAAPVGGRRSILERCNDHRTGSQAIDGPALESTDFESVLVDTKKLAGSGKRFGPVVGHELFAFILLVVHRLFLCWRGSSPRSV